MNALLEYICLALLWLLNHPVVIMWMMIVLMGMEAGLLGIILVRRDIRSRLRIYVKDNGLEYQVLPGMHADVAYQIRFKGLSFAPMLYIKENGKWAKKDLFISKWSVPDQFERHAYAHWTVPFSYEKAHWKGTDAVRLVPPEYIIGIQDYQIVSSWGSGTYTVMTAVVLLGVFCIYSYMPRSEHRPVTPIPTKTAIPTVVPTATSIPPKVQPTATAKPDDTVSLLPTGELQIKVSPRYWVTIDRLFGNSTVTFVTEYGMVLYGPVALDADTFTVREGDNTWGVSYDPKTEQWNQTTRTAKGTLVVQAELMAHQLVVSERKSAWPLVIAIVIIICLVGFYLVFRPRSTGH
jgi:hypothetical protein